MGSRRSESFLGTVLLSPVTRGWEVSGHEGWNDGQGSKTERRCKVPKPIKDFIGVGVNLILLGPSCPPVGPPIPKGLRCGSTGPTPGTPLVRRRPALGIDRASGSGV